jgi:hypothetical protein
MPERDEKLQLLIHNHSGLRSPLKAASLKGSPANQQETLAPYFDHLINQLATFQIRSGF